MYTVGCRGLGISHRTGSLTKLRRGQHSVSGEKRGLAGRYMMTTSSYGYACGQCHAIGHPMGHQRSERKRAYFSSYLPSGCSIRGLYLLTHDQASMSMSLFLQSRPGSHTSPSSGHRAPPKKMRGHLGGKPAVMQLGRDIGNTGFCQLGGCFGFRRLLLIINIQGRCSTTLLGCTRCLYTALLWLLPHTQPRSALSRPEPRADTRHQERQPRPCTQPRGQQKYHDRAGLFCE